jgi:hypothetical protein
MLAGLLYTARKLLATVGHTKVEVHCLLLHTTCNIQQAVC